VIVKDITQTGAYSGGQITSDGGTNITAIGVCWNTSPDPSIINSKTSDSSNSYTFTSHITGLTANTLYYLKAYATNSEGTGYGDQVSFITDEVAVPTLITSGVKCVTLTTAVSGGDVSNDGGIAVTERGVCWNTTGLPTIADSHTSNENGAGLFSSTLTDLTLSTTYYVRAYATNSLGTAYGSEVAFIQIEPVIDNDGNVYSVVTIGTQVWLGENLKATTYKDGTSIPLVTVGPTWGYISTPAFCWYNNSESEFKVTYGALYNWYAVNTGNLCPTGWHVPAVEEYTTLLAYLGGLDTAGGKLKEAGTANWAMPNSGATNESGFTALPGGGRYTIYSHGGTFSDLHYYGYLWSATASTNASSAYSYDMGYDRTLVNKGEYKRSDGGSVRCIKDTK
jgi:uncharacterized protein (TIGR02145 family)